MKANELKKIYKLSSTMLRKSGWALDLPLEKAMQEQPDVIVSLGESQVLRWIDEINGVENYNETVRRIKNKIKYEKKKETSQATRKAIKRLYVELHRLEFQKDYIAIVMDKKNDYDRANEGFTVNGIQYRRFLGTNGGIKKSTIVYVNAAIYPELKKRLDNGRNMNKMLVPAKLEAYQALICSASVPIPAPNGIIVVDDCVTYFKDNVIQISDENGGEPELRYVDGYEVEHNDSDGYGLMLPSYSRRVNQYLTGNDTVISGMNTRYAWTKGMIYSFDFIEFAEKIAGEYEIIDAWGMKRDIRNAEVILTTSMLKLWDSYNSWEEFKHNCDKNHYQFSTPKTTPEKLETVRTTNYQFLQSYDFTDEELQGFCQPAIDEIKDVLGMDYRKSIVFMGGYSMDADTIDRMDDDYNKALMIEPYMINDPYVRSRIHNNIKKRIESTAKGTVMVEGNYSMISGDPYALAQSIFGLTVTGLLKAGEVYHKYWNDNGDTEVVCFRAPMTCHNNIRKMKLNNSEQAQHWYQYITTALIFNCWDTACDAMNGADKDGDTNMVTNNPFLLAKTKNSPTIMCMQRKAEKKIPTEADIIAANKIAFNDDIGTITNYVTSMFDVQAAFPPESEEYKTLAYRIMCGQHYQQASIDRAKGIIAEPMPAYWYSLRDSRIKEGDTPEVIQQKEFNASIAAHRKPYFMTYVYPEFKSKNSRYEKDSRNGAIMRFGKDLKALQAMEDKPQAIIDYLDNYERFRPAGNNACLVNRIAWIIEGTFKGYKPAKDTDFDYTILKSGVEYGKTMFRRIAAIYAEYEKRVSDFQVFRARNRIDKDDVLIQKAEIRKFFIEECAKVCPDEKMLCDMVIDLCYHTNKSKAFAWDVCGHTIIENLFQRNGNKISVPIQDENGDFSYAGHKFKMVTFERVEETEVEEDDTVCIE